MAVNLRCDLCEHEPAQAMFTNLGNGDVVAIGGGCLLTFLLSAAAELAASVDPATVDTYAELASGLAVALGVVTAAAPAPTPAKRRPGRPRKPHVDQGEQGINLPRTVTGEDPTTGDMVQVEL
jgi:hypothetical protein